MSWNVNFSFGEGGKGGGGGQGPLILNFLDLSLIGAAGTDGYVRSLWIGTNCWLSTWIQEYNWSKALALGEYKPTFICTFSRANLQISLIKWLPVLFVQNPDIFMHTWAIDTLDKVIYQCKYPIPLTLMPTICLALGYFREIRHGLKIA